MFLSKIILTVCWLVILLTYLSTYCHAFPFQSNLLPVRQYSGQLPIVQQLRSSFSTNCRANCRAKTIDRSSALSMKDSSTADAYFQVGNRVRVIANVQHNPINSEKFSSYGYEGIVTSVWEKCEVDPHCCCAEMAFDAPIEVTFTNNKGVTATEDTTEGSWKAYYALDEIVKITN